MMLYVLEFSKVAGVSLGMNFIFKKSLGYMFYNLQPHCHTIVFKSCHFDCALENSGIFFHIVHI